ncbi:MAG: hypothetical protein P2A85_24890 [Microcoleus anatoxicus]|uniref:hypothetical protein n=1 Tax=Microcoleus anatoxicus TaxID=2705319 RepID=UPI003672F719
MATYYDLYAPCPACLKDGKYTTAFYWQHDNCGSRLQIGDDAYLKCYSGHSDHIRNWRFACTNHELEYRSTTAAHFAKAISVAGQLADVGGIIWFGTLIKNMGTDW